MSERSRAITIFSACVWFVLVCFFCYSGINPLFASWVKLHLGFYGRFGCGVNSGYRLHGVSLRWAEVCVVERSGTEQG